ncbi:MAG: lysozyme [Pseudomonadota bacterium]
MKTSQRGIDLIRQFEGLELEAYQDIAGIWTIGYGHTGPDVKPGMRISEREAEALLRRDLKPREDAVDDLTSVNLNQNEFDALVSFVYNVGIGAYRGSTARRRLNRGDRIGAADALTWWNKATVGGVLREVAGLTRRRAAERALFLTPANPLVARETGLAENSRVTPVEDSPRRNSLTESRTVQGATVAGGAGVAASTMGRDTAEELDQIETNIENGVSMTEDESAGEGSTPPRRLVDEEDVEAGEEDSDENVAATPEAETDADDSEEDDAADGAVADMGEDGVINLNEEEDTETGEVIMMGEEGARPSKHEVHAVEAQIQFALLVLVVLSVLFIIFARIDDYFKYRR